MDALSDALRVVRLDGGVFLRAEFTAPWCIRSQVAASDCAPLLTDVDRLILYHYVVEGQCAVAVAGRPPMEIGPGDAVIFPRNDPHVMGSDLSLEPVDSHSILKPSSSGNLAYINHGGGGAMTRIVCGFLGYRRVEGNPLIDALPPVLHLDTRKSSAAAWIQSSFQFAADETAMGRAGTTAAHTLLVGDSAIDHETAVRASSRCCLATYGFGYVMFPNERLTGKEWIAASPADLPAIFDRFTAAAG